MKHKEFSVAMCVYGGDNPEHFRLAVESILEQTVPASEIVIAVDGPVPEALEQVIREYESQPAFQVVWMAENLGHGEARRMSLQHCTHDLVALMDADDLSVPQRFEKQLAVLCADETLSIVGSNIAEFIDQMDNVVSYRNVPEDDESIKEYLKKRCPMNQMTVMFRKSAVDSVGGYLDWHHNEDYYLWIRMALGNLRFFNIQEVLVNARIGREMYRRRGGWKYFKSEAKLQRYMRKNRVIGVPTYVMNVGKRLILQVLCPNRLRGWIFRKFARSEKGA